VETLNPGPPDYNTHALNYSAMQPSSSSQENVILYFLVYKGFINVYSRKATGFFTGGGRAKLFELNFFIKKTFCWKVKQGRQNCSCSL